jgi:hypothetical protein
MLMDVGVADTAPRGFGRLRGCMAESAADSVVCVAWCVRWCLVGWDGCEVCLCEPCARVRPCAPCVSRVCLGSPFAFLQSLFTVIREGGRIVAVHESFKLQKSW